MAIDRQAGHAKRMAEHDVGGLASDAGELDERLHVGRHLAAVVLDERLRHADDRRDFCRKNPVDTMMRLDLLGLGGGQRAGVRIALETAPA